MSKVPSYIKASQKEDEKLIQQTKWINSLKREKKEFQEIKNIKKIKKSAINNIIDKYSPFFTFFIDNNKEFEVKSYNEYRQEVQYIEFKFCKFKTPKFLFSWIINTKYNSISSSSSNNSRQLKNDNDGTKKRWIDSIQNNKYFYWFITVAQGKSLYKEFTHSFMTKKETHLFLNGKYDTIEENFIYALATARNVEKIFINNVLLNSEISSPNFVNQMTFNVNSHFNVNSQICKDYTNYFNFVCKNYKNLTAALIKDIYDFLRVNRNIMSNLKGRTVESLINLVNEWHKELHKAKTDKIESWAKKYNDFEFFHNIHTISFKELNTNIELFAEGRAQKHCVGSYVNYCQKGECHIVSMKINNERSCTIEIRRHKIVQVRKRFNALPNEKDILYISKFAKEYNINYNHNSNF